ncbi:MAG: L-serine ammonia-lyase [Phycisphaerae bacterium]|nr:L-serine ammonia-lyase [Phycisphaerae bacterium]
MLSVRSIYKIGKGPSSSHSMAPARAARIFLQGLKAEPVKIKAILYGSLAATGKGHLTDKAISQTFKPVQVDFEWCPQKINPEHPNSLDFIAYNCEGQIIDRSRFYSVGGGELQDDNGHIQDMNIASYPHNTFRELLYISQRKKTQLWQYLNEYENSEIWQYLGQVWQVMKNSVQKGVKQSGILPGEVKLKRRAKKMLGYANRKVGSLRDRNLLSSYALAVAEENASGGTIVTAPTCGSAGVVPAILYFFWRHYDTDIDKLTKALAIAGLIGATVAERASISGAEVGCQGEIGTACAMAAGAAVFLLNGNNSQIEYAAEMGLEHFLGLTCDPISGLVQIPCIERNAFAAMRAMDCAAYALATEGEHLVSLDDIIDVMKETGKDLQEKYRETAKGGLAEIMRGRLL